MRIVAGFAFLACAGFLLIVPAPARAVPLALADHAASSRAVGTGDVQEVRHRSAHRYYARSTAKRHQRRYDWTYYPYYRPYYYHYWKFYYPYGGPLF